MSRVALEAQGMGNRGEGMEARGRTRLAAEPNASHHFNRFNSERVRPLDPTPKTRLTFRTSRQALGPPAGESGRLGKARS